MLDAINNGRLQNLIFDNFNLWTHDVLRTIIGAILKLKPAKVLLANRQIKSRYLRAIAKASFKADGIEYTEDMIDYSHPELDTYSNGKD